MKHMILMLMALFVTTGAQAGGFTTAGEIRPILNATKPNWIAVREFNGHDLVYFTQIEAWRCGLEALKYGLNSDSANQTFTMEPCHESDASPNAMTVEGHMPYITEPLGSVEKVTIELLYDDGTTDVTTFQRDAVEIP